MNTDPVLEYTRLFGLLRASHIADFFGPLAFTIMRIFGILKLKFLPENSLIFGQTSSLAFCNDSSFVCVKISTKNSQEDPSSLVERLKPSQQLLHVLL